MSIAGTPYSPPKAFIAFAREFIEAVAAEDWQAALGRLEQTQDRWTKTRLQGELRRVIGHDSLCSTAGWTQSASPLVVADGEDFVLRHRLPTGGRWTKGNVVFRFERKPGTEYFRVQLVCFEVLSR